MLVEASHAKVRYRAAFKRNPLMPFSHTFDLNTIRHFATALARSA